jgi:hypothetical protein
LFDVASGSKKTIQLFVTVRPQKELGRIGDLALLSLTTRKISHAALPEDV